MGNPQDNYIIEKIHQLSRNVIIMFKPDKDNYIYEDEPRKIILSAVAFSI